MSIRSKIFLGKSRPQTMTHVEEIDGTGRRRTLVAAAQIMNGPRIERVTPKHGAKKNAVSQAWQMDAWTLHDEVGELRSAMAWLAAGASAVRLVAARQSATGGDPDPLHEGEVAELVADWAGGRGSQSQIVRRAALHLALVGDTYLVGETVDADQVPAGTVLPGSPSPGGDGDGVAGEGSREQWEAYSTQEMRYSVADGWQVNDGQSTRGLADALVIRCWHPHPAVWWEAESSVLAARPVLFELRGLGQSVMASIDSRLAGAGLLVLPQSLTFPVGQAAQGGDAEDGEDPFVAELMQAMVTPIKDRDSAAAVVPLVVKVPDDTVGKIQHLSFSTPMDAATSTLREEALKRLAISLDLPPEMLTGLSDSNHWNGYLTSEGAIKMHIKPLVVTIAWALTVGWLRPTLRAMGYSDADDYMVWVDTSELLMRPDRAGHAKDLYDRFAIGQDALRREAGFDSDDAPSDEELLRMIAFRLLDRASDVGPLMEALGLRRISVETLPAGDNDNDDDGDGGDAGGPVGDAPALDPAPGPDDNGDGGGGDGGPSQAVAAVMAGAADVPCDGPLFAAHMAVMRALEIVGKRLLTRDRRGAYQHVPSYRLHTELPVPEDAMDRLLDGAWDTLAGLLGDDAHQVVAAVDDYVRDLLRTGQPHELDWLRAALKRTRT
ncbi:hypothetical protein [Nonomuraea salmonea]|uniref:Phage portal protein n=1 Tax=Nonomuraea salmonea TaxID=46181 RepID=A0ABV5P2L5_9ACTN